jgi:hypothetical protein
MQHLKQQNKLMVSVQLIPTLRLKKGDLMKVLPLLIGLIITQIIRISSLKINNKLEILVVIWRKANRLASLLALQMASAQVSRLACLRLLRIRKCHQVEGGYQIFKWARWAQPRRMGLLCLTQLNVLAIILRDSQWQR